MSNINSTKRVLRVSRMVCVGLPGACWTDVEGAPSDKLPLGFWASACGREGYAWEAWIGSRMVARSATICWDVASRMTDREWLDAVDREIEAGRDAR